MKTLNWATAPTLEQNAALKRPATQNKSTQIQSVADILARIKTEGDAALLEYVQRFDGNHPSSAANLRVSAQALSEAEVDAELQSALALAYEAISRFHAAQMPAPIVVETQPGVRCELHSQAIQSVGLYIPAGTAPLISTILMLAIPARLAGCENIVLCSPAPINEAMLYAANLCGVSAVYGIGGAHAIAAMAYGTATVPKVDKIFGPGNSWVTEAKRQVSQDPDGAAIDMPAGPSEVLVIADETAQPDFVAADLLSQAEHGADSQVILLSNSAHLIAQVELSLQAQLQTLSRAEMASQALDNSVAILCTDLDMACQISNRYAPEHLIVQTAEARALLPKLRHAGSIFLGQWTPESVGDYASGTNHTLPTYGYAKTYSSLGLADFQRRYTVQELSPDGLLFLGQAVQKLAETETLDAHRYAVTVRLDYLAKHA